MMHSQNRGKAEKRELSQKKLNFAEIGGENAICITGLGDGRQWSKVSGWKLKREIWQNQLQTKNLNNS